MKWVSDIPEGHGFETSEVRLVEYEKAIKMLKFSIEKKIVEKAHKTIK